MRTLAVFLGLILLSSCRHVPTARCRRSCESEFDACRARDGMWWDCKERQEKCERECPSIGSEPDQPPREWTPPTKNGRAGAPEVNDGGTPDGFGGTRCPVAQIVEMKKSGMSDSAIEAACAAR